MVNDITINIDFEKNNLFCRLISHLRNISSEVYFIFISNQFFIHISNIEKNCIVNSFMNEVYLDNINVKLNQKYKIQIFKLYSVTKKISSKDNISLYIKNNHLYIKTKNQKQTSETLIDCHYYDGFIYNGLSEKFTSIFSLNFLHFSELLERIIFINDKIQLSNKNKKLLIYSSNNIISQNSEMDIIIDKKSKFDFIYNILHIYNSIKFRKQVLRNKFYITDQGLLKICLLVDNLGIISYYLSPIDYFL